MGIASLVLGIVSLVIAVFIPSIGWAGIIVGIVGIVLAILAKKKGEAGVATAGLVCSIIGAALSLIMYIACIACVAGVKNAVDSGALNDLLNQ